MLAKLLKADFVKNVFILITGNLISQALPILAAPILTRLYTPEDFGLLALFSSITIIASTMVSGKYELAILLPKEKSHAIHLVYLSTFLISLSSALMFFLIYFFESDIKAHLQNNLIVEWLYFIPPTVFLISFYQVLNYWNNRNKQFKEIAKSKVTQSISYVGTSMIAPYTSITSFGLIWGEFFGRLFSLLYLVLRLIKNSKAKKINLRKMFLLAKKFHHFPKFTMFSSWFNTASIHTPAIILQIFFGSSVLGFYALAYRAVNAPLSLVGASVGQVFFQKASESQENLEELRKLTLSTYKKLFALGLIPISTIFIFGDYIFSFVYGKEWLLAGKMAQILAPWIFLVFTISPLTNLYIVLRKQKFAMNLNIIIFICRSIALFYGGYILEDYFQTIIFFGVISFFFWAYQFVYIFTLIRENMFKLIKFTLSRVIFTLGLLILIRFFLENAFG
jgi:O-antigen/teichoic acid export membrane protein